MFEFHASSDVAEAPKMVILGSSGNVGIGLTNPTDALHVVGSIKSSSVVKPVGINFPQSFGVDGNYVGTAGNYLAFGHAGASEDFIGYKDNTFYFRDNCSSLPACTTRYHRQTRGCGHGFLTPTCGSKRFNNMERTFGKGMAMTGCRPW